MVILFQEIKELLDKTKLFQQLSENQLDALFSQAKIKHYNAGEPIINEGELGDCLYILLEGSVRVFTYDFQGKEITLAQLMKGDYFGEQSLIASKPLKRNASVCAVSPVIALSIQASVFQQNLKNNPALQSLLETFGQDQLRHKLLKQLQDQGSEQQKLLSLFQEITNFRPRQVFFRQGDVANQGYYLLSGMVEIRFYDSFHHVKSRNTVNPGQFFGELGVIDQAPRAGTAVAMTDVQVAIIPAKLLRQLYVENIQLKAFFDTTFRLYHVPQLGMVAQYQSTFLDKPAVNTTYTLENGDVIMALRVINANIFSIGYAEFENHENYLFKPQADFSREIFVSDQKILGVLSIGPWSDLDEIAHHVFEKADISEKGIQHFIRTGKLITDSDSLNRKIQNLCVCLQLTYKYLESLILAGSNDFATLTKQTGAGSICGGCRPRIMELLGENSWTLVKITDITIHNDKARSFQLMSLTRPLPAAKPGQFITIKANINGFHCFRSYTLSSSANEENYYEITVKKEPHGLFTNWLFESATVGETLEILEPQGSFIFYPENKNPAICLMAGIGITPALAFARTLINQKLSRPLYVDYSVHNKTDQIFSDEMNQWSEHCPSIVLHLRITAQEGHLTSSIVASLSDRYPNADFFICGPRKYLQEVHSYLQQLNISADKIHIEEFTAVNEPILSIS